MKIIITMILSASFIAASTVITAEGGLMKAIGTADNSPKPLISVRAIQPTIHTKRIRELHGDIRKPSRVMSVSAKRDHRLAKFKAKLKKQRLDRQLGHGSPRVTAAY